MSTGFDIPISATRRSGKPIGLELVQRTAVKASTWRIIVCYAFSFTVACAIAWVLYYASLASDRAFSVTMLILMLIWMATRDEDHFLKRFVTSRRGRMLAEMVAGLLLFIVAMMAVVGVTWLRDEQPAWFLVTLPCFIIWWGTTRGHAMVKWLSR